MRKLVGILTVAGVLVGAVAGTAVAAKPPWAGRGKPPHAGNAAKPAPTKMRFKLVDHSVALGETVEGTVRVLAGKGRHRAPLAGATLTVLVDKVEVGTLTTDADGLAQVSHLADVEGEHVMKMRFTGDGDHRRAQRAQGFEVGVEEVADSEAG